MKLKRMRSVQHDPFFLAFTDGWGDEPIVCCKALAESERDQRLVVCSVDPPIGFKKKVVLYDRFSEGPLLPLTGDAQVGVLLGNVEPYEEPNVEELELTYWATVFSNRDEAEAARARLGPS